MQEIKNESSARIAVATSATTGVVTTAEFVVEEPVLMQPPAIEQKQTVNVVADLETILQERDACGVSGGSV